MRRTILAATVLALAGCAASNDLAAVETADSAALAAVIVYEQTPASKTPAGVALLAKLQADQVQVDALLAPLEAAEASGASVPTAAQLEAVQLAITALTTMETVNGINPATGA